MKKNDAPKAMRSVKGGEKTNDSLAQSQRNTFLVMVLNMSWQLAIVVLVPVLAGVRLDKSLKTGTVYTFVGLGLSLVGAGVVMWRAMQQANRLPVPKLTEEQKRAIKKAYEEEDKEA